MVGNPDMRSPNSHYRRPQIDPEMQRREKLREKLRLRAARQAKLSSLIDDLSAVTSTNLSALTNKPKVTRHYIPQDGRSGGLMVFGPSGWGKSRLLGRSTVFNDLEAGVGQVVLDAVGGTIDNCLDRVLYEQKGKQQELISRIRYCNMAGLREDGQDIHEAYVTPFPVLTKRTTNESLNERAQRFIDLVQKTDENFATASIQGLPRFIHYLTPVLQVLSALNLPITFAYDILTEPENWRGQIIEASRINPEAKLASEELLKLENLHPKSMEDRFDPRKHRDDR